MMKFVAEFMNVLLHGCVYVNMCELSAWLFLWHALVGVYVLPMCHYVSKSICQRDSIDDTYDARQDRKADSSDDYYHCDVCTQHYYRWHYY